jgi:4-amino-4-deoxy-L-arabinose transferase-like glycosyltransferase
MPRAVLPGVVLFFAGVAIYAFVWFGILRAMPMVSDAGDYLDAARTIVARLPQLLPAHPIFWPPATAITIRLFCGPFGITDGTARVLTLVTSALTVVAIRALTRCLTNDPQVVRIAGLAALFYPPAILMAGQSYSQAFAQLWLVLLPLTVLRGWRVRRPAWFALAGFVFGMGCLTHSPMLSLWVVFGGTGARNRAQRYRCACVGSTRSVVRVGGVRRDVSGRRHASDACKPRAR